MEEKRRPPTRPRPTSLPTWMTPRFQRRLESLPLRETLTKFSLKLNSLKTDTLRE